MTPPRALVQCDQGRLARPAWQVAWRGFCDRGYDVTLFEYEDLKRGAVPLDPACCLVGGVGTVAEALQQLGAPALEPLDYPDALRDFLGRRVWATTLGHIRAHIAQHPNQPVFIKPSRDHKRFTGHTVASFRDMIRTAPHDDALLLWASEVVVWRAEYRFYVHRGALVGAGLYHGDPLCFPDPDVVRAMLASFADASPIAYSLDVGVTDDGRTLLVEVNDACSLGTYAIQPMAYSRMVEDRWREQVAPLLEACA